MLLTVCRIESASESRRAQCRKSDRLISVLPLDRGLYDCGLLLGGRHTPAPRLLSSSYGHIATRQMSFRQNQFRVVGFDIMTFITLPLTLRSFKVHRLFGCVGLIRRFNVQAFFKLFMFRLHSACFPLNDNRFLT